MDACARCGLTGDALMRCAGCMTVMYCGVHCQRIAWIDHKVSCRASSQKRKLALLEVEGECRRVFNFEVMEPSFQLLIREDQTVGDLVSFLCHEWLHKERNGDSGLWKHPWLIHVLKTNIRIGLSSKEAVNMQPTLSINTKISDLLMVKGSVADFTYGSSLATSSVSELVLRDIRDYPVNSVPTTPCYNIPAAIPEQLKQVCGDILDRFFPDLARLILQGTQALIFPSGPEVSLAIQSDDHCQGDSLHAPCRFESAEDLLVVCDLASREHLSPCMNDGNSFTRMVFPPRFLSKADETKFKDYSADLADFNGEVVNIKQKNGGIFDWEMLQERFLPRSVGPEERICQPSTDVVALRVAQLRKAGFNFAHVFPKCAEAYSTSLAYKSRRWILFCRGNNKCDDSLILVKNASVRRKPARSDCVLSELQGQHFPTMHSIFTTAERHWP